MPITTPHTALPDLQAAVYTSLQGNSAFTSSGAGLFDPAPTNEVFPYVTFGEHIESNWYSFQNTGRQVLFLFHIWSQKQNYDEAYAILNVITGALETAGALTLTNFTMNQYGLLFDSATKRDDPDGVSRQLIAKYKTYLTAK